MTTLSIREAQASLPDLIHQLTPGEEVIVTENGQPVARFVSAISTKTERKLGSLQGTVRHMSPDFDAPLDDFKEYME